MAAERTVERIGAVIAASAATVIVGLVALAVARFGLVQTIGPAMALAIAVTLAAGLTLAPAFLVIFGSALFWPRHPKPVGERATTSAWDRLAAAIVRRPVVVASAVVALLAIPALLLPAPTTNFDMLAELPTSSDARIGFERVADHMDRGRLMPIVTYLDDPALDLATPAGLAAIARVTAAVAETEGVASVRSLVAPTGDGVAEDLHPSTRLEAIADGARSLALPGALEVALADPRTWPGSRRGWNGWRRSGRSIRGSRRIRPGRSAMDAQARLMTSLGVLMTPGAPASTVDRRTDRGRRGRR